MPREMKPEDVRMALEHHSNPIVSSCQGCPYMGVSEYDEDNFCTDYLIKDALALLCEKDATIADYIMQIAEMQNQIATQDRILTDFMKRKEIEADKDAEIERLTKERDLANAEREANVKGFTEELQNTIDRYKGVIRILEQDIAHRDKLLEGKIEEAFPEFMRDYKQLQEENQEICKELEKLRNREDDDRC